MTTVRFHFRSCPKLPWRQALFANHRNYKRLPLYDLMTLHSENDSVPNSIGCTAACLLV